MDASSELLNKLLNLDKVRVMQTEFASETKVMLFVESRQDVAICPDCGQVSKYGSRFERSTNCARFVDSRTELFFELSCSAVRLSCLWQNVCGTSDLETTRCKLYNAI